MPPSKFSFWDWLIYTQLHEIIEAHEQGPQHRAEEECDMIGILIQDMLQAGFDPAETFKTRLSSNIQREPEIYKKYTESWEKVLTAWHYLKCDGKFGSPQ